MGDGVPPRKVTECHLRRPAGGSSFSAGSEDVAGAVRLGRAAKKGSLLVLFLPCLLHAVGLTSTLRHAGFAVRRLALQHVKSRDVFLVGRQGRRPLQGPLPLQSLLDAFHEVATQLGPGWEELTVRSGSVSLSKFVCSVAMLQILQRKPWCKTCGCSAQRNPGIRVDPDLMTVVGDTRRCGSSAACGELPFRIGEVKRLLLTGILARKNGLTRTKRHDVQLHTCIDTTRRHVMTRAAVQAVHLDQATIEPPSQNLQTESANQRSSGLHRRWLPPLALVLPHLQSPCCSWPTWSSLCGDGGVRECALERAAAQVRRQGDARVSTIVMDRDSAFLPQSEVWADGLAPIRRSAACGDRNKRAFSSLAETAPQEEWPQSEAEWSMTTSIEEQSEHIVHLWRRDASAWSRQ